MLILFIFLFSLYSQDELDSSQDSSAIELAPLGESEDSILASPDIVGQTTNVTKGLDTVDREIEDYFIIKTKNKKVPKGQKVLFIRSQNDVVDILSSGEVEAQQEDRVFVKIDRGSIIKYPVKGDLVTFMAHPWSPDKEDDDDKVKGSIIVGEDPLPDDPGYIQIDMGQISSDMSSTTANQANEYKKTSFTFSTIHFEWYLDFAWKFGIEYESFSGDVPLRSFQDQVEDTSWDYTYFGFNYRLRRFNEIYRWTFRLGNFTESFSTTNSDEYVIASDYSGILLGLRFAAEFASEVWKPEKSSIYKFQKIYVDLNYSPNLSAEDSELISRGEEGSGSLIDLRIGTNMFFYFSWIPYVKRFNLELIYGLKQYDIGFSGPTTSETDDMGDIIYAIPEGGSYKESHDYIMIRLGIRFDDVVGKFLNPR